jgi:hypothetical protein
MASNTCEKIMNSKENNKILNYLQQNILFIILFAFLLTLEFFSFNHDFFISQLNNLIEQEYYLSDATLSGFSVNNGGLIAKNDDPNITFPNSEQRTRFIKLECSNFNPAAMSQIYYQNRDQGFMEVNSVIFSLTSQRNEIKLPRTVRLSDLRFDLTNKENDEVFCQGITINANRTFDFSFLRLGLLILCGIGLVYGNKIIPNNISKTVWELMINNGMLIFIILIVIISTAYPLTLTVDSAHYLWLSDLFKQANWANWDPFRNVGFPFQIIISNMLFGSGRDGALIPMIIARVVLYIFSCLVIFEIFKISSRFKRFIVSLFIFIFIIMDPTIFGYYQTILTEYVAATIAMVSSFMAIQLYKTPIFSRRFFGLSTYFLIMCLLSWHLKQDYVGAALFPFMIIVFLIALKNFSWKHLAYMFLSFSIIALMILTTTLGWHNFLESQDNPMDQERDVSLMAGESLDSHFDSLQNNLANYFRSQLYNYFRSINFWVQEEHQPINEYSLTYGFQNRLIAHRMFLNLPAPNLINDYPFLDPYFEPYSVRFAPHNRINAIFKSRIKASNFLFSFSYLVLPIFVLTILILWIRKKSLIQAALLVLSGTALLNALIHLLTGKIDRYLFPGYPLILIILVILIGQAGNFLATKYSKLREEPTKTTPDANT